VKNSLAKFPVNVEESGDKVIEIATVRVKKRAESEEQIAEQHSSRAAGRRAS
jgi:hypothetical protein